jgi:hypothetical protein
LQNRFTYLIIIFLLTGQFQVKGQKSSFSARRDTLFVFETVTVYDTIFIHDTIWEIKKSKLGALNPKGLDLSISGVDFPSDKARLLILFKNHAATIPINSIILTETNKNISGMKKLSFFGVVFLAFQSMVAAQTTVGLSAGLGSWWARCNKPIVSSEFSPALNMGLFVEYPLSKNLFIRTELNYSYLSSNSSYKAMVDTLNKLVVGEGESASGYHQFSLPLQVGYQLGNFRPLLGMEYSYRLSESWLHRKIKNFGVLVGLNYSVDENLSFGINYNRGLTKDYEYSGMILSPVSSKIVGDYDCYWKSGHLGLSVYYSLRNPKPREKDSENISLTK